MGNQRRNAVQDAVTATEFPAKCIFPNLETHSSQGIWLRSRFRREHSKTVVDVPNGTVIPIPMHGKNVQEAYIKELKALFAEIETRNKDGEQDAVSLSGLPNSA